VCVGIGDARMCVKGGELAGAVEGLEERSSGFAIRKPPNDLERLRSPSISRPDGCGFYQQCARF
jgi:hypothetical protein